MQIILLNDIDNFGKKGEAKTVSDGYFRNFLFPQGLAVSANSAKAQIIKARALSEINRKQKNENLFKKSTHKLANLVLNFTAKASTTGTLFSGINKKDIASKLNEKTAAKISEKNIILEGDIKKIGEYQVQVKIDNNISTIKINVKNDDK